MVELIDPKSPLSKAEELVFGVDAVRHPLLGIPIGHGKGPPIEQARNFLRSIRDAGQVTEAEFQELARKTGAAFAGFAGNAAAAPSFNNNTQQYPSIATLKAALSAGQITQAQFVSYSLATEMFAQTQIRAARDTLVGTGDTGSV